jgi:hypothetical protein
MQLFGKEGANLIPVFASEAFKNSGSGLSGTARLLTEHAAEFKEQKDLNSHVFGQIWEQASVGFNSVVAAPNTTLAKAVKRQDFSEISRLGTAYSISGIGGLASTALKDYSENKEYSKDPEKWKKEHGGKAPAAFDASNIGEGRFKTWGDDLARVGGGGHYANLSGTRDKQEITNQLLREIREAVKSNKGVDSPAIRPGATRQMARFA